MSYLPPPEDDGLIIPDVNDWSHDKHHFLERYLHAFSTSMKHKWSSRHYIDLFAGAGLERLKTTQELEWGSALIAAQVPDSFDAIHACEMNEEKYEALRVRLLAKHPHANVLFGDANEKVQEIVHRIPSSSLCLAFLDPYGLHLRYETLQVLSQHRADLIIFFPDQLDILRNWATYYLENPNSNLDLYLGPGADWRTLLLNAAPARYGELILNLYQEQIGKLGYKCFEYERIHDTQNRPLYRLIFCSKHSRGAKLWNDISLKKPDGQREFDWPDT